MTMSATAKKIFIICVLISGAVLIGFLLVGTPRAGDDFDSSIEYLTAEVTRGPLVAAVAATGRIKAVLEVKVGTQLSGQVAELHADFNDLVTAGQPLAQLDARSYEARMREAKANLDISRANVLLQQAAIVVAKERIASAEARSEESKRKFDRLESLRKNNTVSQAAVDEARAEYQAASATHRGEQAQFRIKEAELEDAVARVARDDALLAQVEIELSRTLITAPIDGVIVGRGVEEGQTVAASLQSPTLFEIAQDLSQMEVHVRVDEADIGQIQVAQPISFTVDAYPAQLFNGSVTEIRKSPAVVNNVVTYTVVVSAENPDLLLLPGMTATVRMVVLEVADAIRIPNAALRFRPPGISRSKPGPLASQDGDAPAGRPAVVWVSSLLGDPAPMEIRIGASDGSATELLSGNLDEGDEVVVGTRRSADKPSLLDLRRGS